MTALNDFLNNPPEFMRRNHVVFTGQSGAALAGRSHTFSFIAMERLARYRSSIFLGIGGAKRNAGAFTIRASDAGHADLSLPGAETFAAIWSGFVAGGKVKCDLENTGPDIMLTPQLSGCAVAFSAQSNGQASFSHYNNKTGSATQDAAAMAQHAYGDYPLDPGLGLLTKEAYRNRGKDASRPLLVTALGWRKEGVWTFWAQYTEIKGGVHQIRGVERLQPGMWSA
jgi:hypothetical protein